MLKILFSVMTLLWNGVENAQEKFTAEKDRIESMQVIDTSTFGRLDAICDAYTCHSPESISGLNGLKPTRIIFVEEDDCNRYRYVGLGLPHAIVTRRGNTIQMSLAEAMVFVEDIGCRL